VLGGGKKKTKTSISPLWPLSPGKGFGPRIAVDLKRRKRKKLLGRTVIRIEKGEGRGRGRKVEGAT